MIKFLITRMFYKVNKFKKEILHFLIGDWYYFLYDEQKHEKALIRKCYNEFSSNKLISKTVIFMANGFCNHAGLCDRFKGMTTLYGWCKENKIDFRIYHIYPFNLNDYIIPNLYDWQISDEQISYNKNQVSVNHCMLNQLVKKQIQSGEIASLEHKWFIRRLFNSNKKQLHFYTNMYPESDLLFGKYFKELFKPAPRVEDEISNHLKQIGQEYISVSFRFMQLLGDFKDCDGNILLDDQQELLIHKSINILYYIKEQNPDVERMLVTADSIKFLQAARHLPFVYIIKGEIGHINFIHSDEVNMKTFLDFYMIANAKKIYLAKSGEMYNSDFARRASMIYEKPFKIVDY